MNLIKQAWEKTLLQRTRFLWLYALSVLGGLMMFFAAQDETIISSAEAGAVLGPIFVYSFFDYIISVFTFFILYRIMSTSVGVKLTFWRFVKMQVPAIASAMLLAFSLAAIISASASLLVGDAVDDKGYLVAIMLSLSLLIFMFYFLFVQVYLQRYSHIDNGGKGAWLDYFKSVIFVAKTAPVAALFFIVYLLFVGMLKTLSAYLNVEGFDGIGIFTSAVTAPLLGFTLVCYLLFNEKRTRSKILSWSA